MAGRHGLGHPQWHRRDAQPVLRQVSESTGTDRRSALGRIALLAAGALGVGYAAREATDGGSSSPAAAPRRTESRTVYGREWRLHSPNRVPGESPPAGDRPTPQGRLVDDREHTLQGPSRLPRWQVPAGRSSSTPSISTMDRSSVSAPAVRARRPSPSSAAPGATRARAEATSRASRFASSAARERQSSRSPSTTWRPSAWQSTCS